MTALPWDRFPTEPPQPVPLPPPVQPSAPPAKPSAAPTAPQPPPPPTTAPADIDIGGIIATTMKETVSQLLPVIKEQAVDYAHNTGVAAAQGQHVDHDNPTITATTANGRTLVVADAKSRSWRTFWQGLAVDILFALTALLTTLAGLDPFAKETWIILGALAIKTLVQSVVSYLARLRITPTITTDDGAKMALMPIARPMVATDKFTRRSDHNAEIAAFLG